MRKNKNEEKPTEELLETPEGASDTAENPEGNSIENKEEETPKEKNELDALKEELETLKDAHLRTLAEYDNYRKRTMKEKADLIKTAGERILTQFLEVIDDFDRALEHTSEEADATTIQEGVELIYKKFQATLTTQGVTEMQVIGEVFDPEIHEAVAMVSASNGQKTGTIIDCVKKGYLLYDKVIRHPKVVVAQ